MVKPPTRSRRKRGRHYSEARDLLFKEIVDMMVNGTWITGQSHLTLAEREGVHVDHIKRTASEASRFIRLSAGNDEDIRQAIVNSIDLGTRLATDRKKPALGALTSLLQLKAEVRLSGLKDAKANEPSVHIPIEELNQLLAGSGLKVVSDDATSTPAADQSADDKPEE